MRIDAQVGFVDRSRFHYEWLDAAATHMQRDFTPADLRRILDRNKYEGAIAVALLDDPAETDWLLRLAREHSWIAGVVGSSIQERWLRDDRFVGVRLNAASASRSIVAAVVDAGVAVDLVARPSEIPRAEALVDAVPGGRFVLLPAAGPEWDAAPWERVARHAAIAVKVSGLINDAGPNGWKAATHQPFVARMLEWCRPTRLMYGSDWPRCMRSGTWKESLAAFTQAMGARTIETRSRILGDNAAEFYRRRESIRT